MMLLPLNSPSISVITACLNAAEFIEQTIQSVLSQTYPQMEYIIVDGASTDGTVDIIRKYESRLAYWHSKPDRGLAHAFNLGLAQAHGEWILYLNADDYFPDSSVIEKMIPHLVRHTDADVVYGQIALIPRDGLPVGAPANIFGGPLQWERFRLVCILPHQAAFTSRTYFDRVGNFYERIRIAVDYEHYLRGGPNLKAIFVPQIVSAMRLGGIGHKYRWLSLKEWQYVQTLNRVAPVWLIRLNYLSRWLWLLSQELFPGLIKKFNIHQKYLDFSKKPGL
jgi:glycosyltransferase involved in cell wall biosynthesis